MSKKPSSSSSDPEEFLQNLNSMNPVQMVSAGKDLIADLIIKPPNRQQYHPSALGPVVQYERSKRVIRQDLEITNERGLKLSCSHYVLASKLLKQKNGEDAKHPCVVFLHGYGGCRMDARMIVPWLVPNGISVFSFDFAGSGVSEGEFVSFGFHEKNDVTAVVSFLKESPLVSTIGLWGFSMGASTTVLYLAMQKNVEAAVIDSPFASLPDLMTKIVDNATKEMSLNIPNFLISIGISAVRKVIKSKAGFDIKEVKPIKVANKCTTPALFFHGLQDQLISSKDTEGIHQKYKGDKNLLNFEGEHIGERPSFCFESALNFFQLHLLNNEPYTNEPDPSDDELVQAGISLESRSVEYNPHYGYGDDFPISPDDPFFLPVVEPHLYRAPAAGAAGGGGGFGGGADDEEARMLEEAIRLSLLEAQQDDDTDGIPPELLYD